MPPAPAIMRGEGIPVTLRDAKDRLYVAVPLTGKTSQRLFWGSVWERSHGLNGRLAGILRLTREEQKRIRSAVEGAWRSCDAIAEHLKVTELDGGGLKITADAAALRKIDEKCAEVTKALLARVQDIIGIERTAVLCALGGKDLRYTPLYGLGSRSRMQGITSYELKVKPAQAQWAGAPGFTMSARSRRGLGGGSSTSGGSGGAADMPCPKIAKRLGYDDDTIGAAWGTEHFYHSGEHAPAPEVHIAGKDTEGRRYIFYPWGWGSHWVPVYSLLGNRWGTAVRKDPGLNPTLVAVLRLGEAEETKLIGIITKHAKLVDAELFRLAVVTERSKDLLSVEIPAGSRPALKTCMEAMLAEIAGTFGPDTADVLAPVAHMLPGLDDYIPRDILKDGKELNQPPGATTVTLTVPKEKGWLAGKHLEFQARHGNGSTSGQVTGDEVPNFLWRLSPPEFARYAPERAKPGSEKKPRDPLAEE